MIIEEFNGIKFHDLEGETIEALVNGDKNILEVGCGSRKTIPHSIGLDILPKGKNVHNVFPPGVSIADIICDVSKKLPIEDLSQDIVIARHTLEHIVDVAEALESWNRVLKIGGKLILALPDHAIANTILMDNTHVHAFTKESSRKIISKFGFKHLQDLDPKNDISFISCYEKIN